jgi:hypothetical protein
MKEKGGIRAERTACEHLGAFSPPKPTRSQPPQPERKLRGLNIDPSDSDVIV